MLCLILHSMKRRQAVIWNKDYFEWETVLKLNFSHCTGSYLFPKGQEESSYKNQLRHASHYQYFYGDKADLFTR